MAWPDDDNGIYDEVLAWNVATITSDGTDTNSISNVTWTVFVSNNTSGNVIQYNSYQFDPVQVEQLRADYRTVKEDRKRKRAEIKAQRLFKRTVGEVAYRKFLEKGYHEIFGASRARYRLLPGKWVRVMGEGDAVDHELCAHLAFGIPWFDTMTVQHLMLTASRETEDQFRKIANRHAAGIYPIEEMRDVA